MRSSKRNENGSMLFLIVCIVAVIFIPLMLIVGHYSPIFVNNGRAQNVVEAASLLAASDLSRLVINDPHYGYVSLSNYPAKGNRTCALDGQPLPVTGINTIIGTLRQNELLACELQNQTMKDLISKDHAWLFAANKRLNSQLERMVSGNTRPGEFVDTNGKDVDPVSDVEEFLNENLPANVKLESVKISLGWLEGGSETTIAVPQPLPLARLGNKVPQNGNYEGFRDYPVEGHSYIFAGLGSQAHMVSSGKFKEPDGRRVCSVIKLEATLVSDENPGEKIHCVACSQASTQPDEGTWGAMTIRFAGRPVPGLLSWNDFLTESYFHDNRVTTYDIVGGDYPYDRQARMKEIYHDPDKGTTDQFAEHLYYWLRSGRLRPRMDSVLAMMNEPFQNSADEVYIYQFKEDGSIARSVCDGRKFSRAVTADGQFSSMADTRVKNGAYAIVLFRDNVMRLSTQKGKHAGQPLSGYPLGHEDGEVDHEQLAAAFSQRSPNSQGLALDIEIGGTADRNPNQAIISMREHTRGRKI